MLIGGVIGFLSIIPSLINKDTAVPLVSSSVASLTLLGSGVCQITLGLWFAGSMCLINGLSWAFIAGFRRV